MTITLIFQMLRIYGLCQTYKRGNNFIYFIHDVGIPHERWSDNTIELIKDAINKK